MSRPTLSSMCRRCQTHFLSSNTTTTTTSRAFSTTLPKPQAADDISIFEQALRPRPRGGLRRLPSSNTGNPSTIRHQTPTSSNLDSLAEGARNEASTRPSGGVSDNEPYHLNVYAHKHNMHITFTEPGRNPIISYSAGNIGLRKAQRGSFDAAYQLSTYTMRKMAEKQWRLGGKGMTMNPTLTLSDSDVSTRGIEVVLRGYGPGREAFQKALLGNEGRVIKPLVKKVTDGTRLKFGGTRSPQVRRLG